MKNILFAIVLTFNTLIITSNIHAQDVAPSYESLITMGDKEFNNSEYIKAKSYYQEALRLKQDDPVAKSKLNKALQKIREQSEKETIFFGYIDEADIQYENGEYEKALETYKTALKLFPKDSYTLEQISTITQKINEEKEKIASFNNFVNNGDGFMSQKKYTEATLQYKAAHELYPNNNTIKEKYAEAKKLKEDYDKQFANFERLRREGKEFTLRKKYQEAIEKYQEALTIFPNDSDTKEIIASLTEKKITSDKYNSKIGIADSLYFEKSYNKAKDFYKEALTIIPEDTYSSDMIAKIDETLNSDEYKSLKKFLEELEEAKKLENNREYENALTKYNSALKLNPTDEYTTQKIDYLTDLIEKKNKEAELITQYESIIKHGDSSVSEENYDKAIEYYNKAKELLPHRNEAIEKIKSTQKIIDEIEAQLALEKEKWGEYYITAMASAQDFMNSEDYPNAIKEYTKALKFKENDSDAIAGLNNATQLNNKKLADLMAEYNKYITEADTQYNSNNLDKAIEPYKKALALNTGETYPTEMIEKINKTFQENKIAVLVNEPTEINSTEAKKFTFSSLDPKIRKNNYIIIKAKNHSEDVKSIYISYGSQKGNNGKLEIKTSDNQDINEYIVKIGSQYKWFSEDNTWIELTTDNGNIEIELMEITKGN